MYQVLLNRRKIAAVRRAKQSTQSTIQLQVKCNEYRGVPKGGKARGFWPQWLHDSPRCQERPSLVLKQ